MAPTQQKPVPGIGDPSDTAWNGSDPSPSLIAVMKALYGHGGASVFKPFTIAASGAETTIWTPAAGKKVRLLGFALFSDTATVLTFRDGIGLATIWKDGVAANSRAASPPLGNGIPSGAADRVLTLQATTAATINGVVFGVEE